MRIGGSLGARASSGLLALTVSDHDGLTRQSADHSVRSYDQGRDCLLRPATDRRSKRVCASSSAGVKRLEDDRGSVKAPSGWSVGLCWGG